MNEVASFSLKAIRVANLKIIFQIPFGVVFRRSVAERKKACYCTTLKIAEEWLFLCFRMILCKKRSVGRGKHNVSIHDTRSEKSSYDPRSSIILLSNNAPLRCLPSFSSWSMFNSWSTSHCCCHFIAYLFPLQFEYIPRALVFISIWVFK